jgi:pilus assembly protein FimV
MARRFIRILLAFVMLLSGNVWALGLGEIRLESALNEPLHARIELLSAVPGELDNLNITLASAETFQRYGLDRPFFLQGMQFKVVRSGSVDGNYVEVRSSLPITEPFLTFLVEASWPRGRLLREYTVLLDPPTFMPPLMTQTQPAVTAPQRSTPADSGRIERQPSLPSAQADAEPVEDGSYAFDDETYIADDSYADDDETYIADDSYADDDESYIADDSYADDDEFYVADDAAADDDESYIADDSYADDDESYAYDETYGSDETPDYYDTAMGGDHHVVRGETLWGITSRVKADSRLTMNQAMLAIFEANPEAFGGNINILHAGANLRIPSADEIFQIDRGYALAEAIRHHAAWGGARTTTPVPAPVEPVVVETTSQPTLTLVPPDEEPVGIDLGIDTPADGEPMTREQEVLDRIAELEAADIPPQPSLIEIRDNELATLRHELANIRGETYEPLVDDAVADDAADDVIDDATTDPFADDIMTDTGDVIADGTDDAEPVSDQDSEAADITPPPIDVIRSAPSSGPTIVERIIDALTSIWAMIGGAVIVAGAILIWFMRRDRGDDIDDEATGQWTALDADELGVDALSSTEQMQVPVHDDGTFVVVEQESLSPPQEPAFEPQEPVFEPEEPVAEAMDDTYEAPTPEIVESSADTGQFDSLEDTFSSETAINLDQSDPVAEADFHMAYGLYDQAADLINGALEVEPDRHDLLTKLAEIYFVWGNRDAFVDAARRLKAAVGDTESAEWDKIVIMGQQIAADHELFAGAGVAAATRAVDLSFEGGMEEASALDMDFGTVNEPAANVFGVGEDGGQGDVDFVVEETGENEILDSPTAEVTAQMPTIESTLESPTIEQPFDALFEATSELPSIDDVDDVTAQMPGQPGGQETGEIDLEDLNLDLSALEETEVASLDDLDATGANEELSDTGVHVALDDADEVTGKNPELDPDSTGIRQALARDETGQNPMVAESAVDIDTLTDVGIDESLLDATGQTQVLGDDMAVEAISDLEKALVGEEDTMLAPAADDMDASIADDQATMLAPADDDEGDFDFAKTEALPADAFTATTTADETGELPAVASTDVDLDLDDLTAALKVSEMGDTVDMPRDDATVEYPRPEISGDDDEVPTLALGPDELSDDLHEARTMTEVGTKLDLARAYVDMGDPTGAKGILKEVLDEGDESQQQQAQQLLDSLPG